MDDIYQENKRLKLLVKTAERFCAPEEGEGKENRNE
jgi:hypothetical protein